MNKTEGLKLLPNPPREEGYIYIDELRHIINREMGTIRKWERTESP